MTEHKTTVCECETCQAHRGVNDCNNCNNTAGDSHTCGLYAAQTDECLKGPGRQYWERRESHASTVHDDGLSDREKLERYLEQGKQNTALNDIGHTHNCQCVECGELTKSFNKNQEGMPCDFCSHHVNQEPAYCVTCDPENSNYDGYEFEVQVQDNELGHNNGGSTDYYKFHPSWTDCQDVIEDRSMNFSQGNIFKVAFCFNIGRHSAVTYERELNKIIWFVQRELNRVQKELAEKEPT